MTESTSMKDWDQGWTFRSVKDSELEAAADLADALETKRKYELHGAKPFLQRRQLGRDDDS